MSDSSKKYGWFSYTAARNQDLIVTYTTKLGSTVVVSAVTNDPHDSGTAFKDIEYIGELDKFVSSISKKD